MRLFLGFRCCTSETCDVNTWLLIHLKLSSILSSQRLGWESQSFPEHYAYVSMPRHGSSLLWCVLFPFLYRIYHANGKEPMSKIIRRFISADIVMQYVNFEEICSLFDSLFGNTNGIE